jgi:hypothetical protein
MCVHLAFGDQLRVRTLTSSERLTALSSQLYWPGIGAAARDLLELIALPQIAIERPRGAEGLAVTVRLLMTKFEEIDPLE